jgi:exopolyphosphatase/guanosine-5'-triphosphate,3'-diphosphate pyrophosphatase
MRCACIDIGSNTTRLLVAEPRGGQLAEVMATRTFTRLGAGRDPDGEIPLKKIAETAETVATQVRLARECDVTTIAVVATAAIRTAPNREALCAAVRDAAGVDVTILSGEEEARYAFAGATKTLDHLPLGLVGVVDVGGGSSELVTGTLRDGVEWSASFRVGSGFLADNYLQSDPPSIAELDHVRGHVAGIFEGLEAPTPRVAYAVGGSATSLRRLLGAELSHETLQRGLHLLSTTPIAEVARRFDLNAERVRLLPAGMVLLDEAAAVLGAPLQISKGGLREGVILETLTEHGEGT